MLSESFPNNVEPPWISKDLVLAMHEEQLAEHGGRDGLRDEGMLDSALGRPQNLYAYGDPPPTVCHLAAAYAYGIARNHPFLDGNKRVSFLACDVFLKAASGCKVAAPQVEIVKIWLALAEGSISEEFLAAWLQGNTAPA